MERLMNIIHDLGIVTLLPIYLLIMPSCEPAPKMIGYGSNDFGQLEFSGTNWQDQSIAQGFLSSWAGGNFSIAYYLGPATIDSGLVCKGDNTHGQCDIPDSLMSFADNNGLCLDMSLGLNHGMAWVDSSTYDCNYGTHLYLWGDNTHGQATLPELPDTSRILQMAAGWNHNVMYIGNVTLVLDSTSGYYENQITNPQIIAWGDDSYGQCDVPARFQTISDSIQIQGIYAGANHTMVTYDSLGTLRMVAWGDNTYGQSEVLSESELNGSKTLYELHCGYNHNVAVFVDYETDITSQFENGEYVDSLFIIEYVQVSDYAPSLQSHHPVSLHAWGDNTHSQCDIPDLSGLFEDIDVGGSHNSIAITDNSTLIFDEQYYYYYDYYNYILFASGRSIIGWGKDDHGQTHFPIEYVIDWAGAGGGYEPGGPANSPPILALGGDHTLVRGSHLYRAPSLDHSFPEQFSGALGDTIYQTITLYGIGPDTVHIDSIFILTYDYYDGYVDTLGTHPFYVEQHEQDFILFEDSLNLQVYCIYDSTHLMNENANLFIHSQGWWPDTTVLPLNSFFGPVIEINSYPNEFVGNYGETVFQSVEFHNVGNAIAYLDSIVMPENFEYEPFGEDDFILPNDSLEIFLFTTLPEYPLTFGGQALFHFSNFNTITEYVNLNARRYMMVGDNMSLSNYYNYNVNYCGQDIIGDGEDYFSMSGLSEPTILTNIYYVDLGYFDGNDSTEYALQLDSISIHFDDNPHFVSMIGIGNENFQPGMGNNTFSSDCDSLLSAFDQRENKLVFLDTFLDQHFEEDVQSVVIDQEFNITYMGPFDQDSIILYVQDAIDDCGIDCLTNSSLTISPEMLFLTVPQNSLRVDTVTITNTTDYSLDYALDTESGIELVSSVLFHYGNGGEEMTAPVESISSPATISLWVKPLETDWYQGPDDPYTNFLSPLDTSSMNYWEIIFDSNVEYPRIGWKEDETYSLSDTPILPTDWYHCVFVHDLPNQIVRLYVNGVEEFSHQISRDLHTDSQIGINAVGPGTYTGFLSQTSIWNTALSDSEIVTIHDLGINADHMSDHGDYGSADELLVYWRMDDQNGYTVTDHSGNGYHAQVTGNQDIWRTELLQSLQPWLNVMIGGGSQTIEPNGSAMAIISVNSNSLESGNYTGLIRLVPDHNPYANTTNIVRMTVIDELQTSSVGIMPSDYALHQNYPNPFNPVTDIRYDLPENEFVSIMIYDVMGREVRSLTYERQVAGFHQVQWNGKNDMGAPVSSGMYLYMLKAGEYVNAKKMVMLK